MKTYAIHFDKSAPGEKARYPHKVAGWHGIESVQDWSRVTCKQCLKRKPVPDPVVKTWAGEMLVKAASVGASLGLKSVPMLGQHGARNFRLAVATGGAEFAR